MNIPGYDDWRLRGPEEDLSVMLEACEACDGTGEVEGNAMIGFGMFRCSECYGTGDDDDPE
jgi:DnaJ-class molecular chaperone